MLWTLCILIIAIIAISALVVASVALAKYSKNQNELKKLDCLIFKNNKQIAKNTADIKLLFEMIENGPISKLCYNSYDDTLVVKSAKSCFQGDIRGFGKSFFTNHVSEPQIVPCPTCK